MPTYEYRCSAGHQFEQFQRMSEPPLDTCPACGAPAERLLSAGAGLLFKGSGFYITDYRSDSYRKAAEADKGGGKTATDAGSGTSGAKGDGSSGSGGTKSDTGTGKAGGSTSGKAE